MQLGCLAEVEINPKKFDELVVAGFGVGDLEIEEDCLTIFFGVGNYEEDECRVELVDSG